MKKILMNAMIETLQDDKVAKATIGAGAATATGTILEWLPTVIGIIASATTIIFSLFLLYFHMKKNKREEELHQVKMAQLMTRRSTDDRR